MKILTLKRVVGLAAIGGAMAYARKHGGFKNAIDELLGKKTELEHARNEHDEDRSRAQR